MTKKRLSTILNEKADETNDIHDHDELHAAAVVQGLLENGFGWGMITNRDRNYLTRWIEGLK